MSEKCWNRICSCKHQNCTQGRRKGGLFRTRKKTCLLHLWSCGLPFVIFSSSKSTKSKKHLKAKLSRDFSWVWFPRQFVQIIKSITRLINNLVNKLVNNLSENLAAEGKWTNCSLRLKIHPGYNQEWFLWPTMSSISVSPTAWPLARKNWGRGGRCFKIWIYFSLSYFDM